MNDGGALSAQLHKFVETRRLGQSPAALGSRYVV
jgi:hypothetical protein